MQARPVRSNACRNASVLGISVFTLLTCWPAPAPADPFTENIRTTEPLPPEQQQKTFHLPPGFEIQLVAADPDIGKVMNLAFDARGQLWLTQSREYPFAAPTNAPARDQIKVLSDFGPDGRARKITTFAEGLNLPIGLLPYRDGVIAFSIPNIYYFADTNGDGHADTKELIIGSIGFDRDTHGLTSAFRRGYDGWIYADHGFNNNSTLKAKDGNSITMNSGNTYRFKPDGSRVEQFTWGQVNPFGLMFDPLGDLWSSDCHSQPVYQLLRGAYYPSFGKPHDGLGFGPSICSHHHGSTAIAGIVFYAATNFPAEFRGNTFVGNVMTCRINRDSYVEHGSTRIAKEKPDFLRSDDPWFRPVDLQLGPDGALYVADFYNRIIGHYEVALDHPGRDRERGRVWRIVYRGTAGSAPAPAKLDLTQAKPAELIRALGDANIAVRTLALNQLVDRIGKPAAAPVTKMMRDRKASPEQKANGLWALHRLDVLDLKTLTAAARDSDRMVRVHAMRVLSEAAPETRIFSKPHEQLVLAGLRDSDPYVQRAAADALGQHAHGAEHGDFVPLDRLLALIHQVPAEDTQLRHVIRMALRNHLRVFGAFPHLEKQKLAVQDSGMVADIALGVPGDEPAAFLLQHVQKYSEPRDRLVAFLRHVGRYANPTQLDSLRKIISEKFADDFDAQFALFKSIQDGLAQRGAKLTPELRAWAAEVAEQLLAPADDSKTPWVNVPLKRATDNPWFLQKRPSADGDEDATFLCSLPPNGEALTGILRSHPFTIPPQLSFYLAGHDGSPDKPPKNRNLIRLRTAYSTEVLMSAPPPRNDVAQKVTWDLKGFAGKKGVLEIVDADTGSGFAWLAAGRFEPAVVPMPLTNPNHQNQRPLNAAELVRTVPLPELAPRFVILFADVKKRPEFRVAAAQTLLALEPLRHMTLLAVTLADTNQPGTLRESLAFMLAGQNSPVAREAVLEALRVAPQRLQVKLALVLAGNTPGADALLTLVEQKKISPQVIVDPAVKERLTAAKPPQFTERYGLLTKGVLPVSVELQKLIDERRAGFDRANPSPERGRAVFEKSCVVCHQLDGKGAIVGPQLDGVGNRGLERIIEDVLDPSRNIDPAFRPSLVTLKDDTSITGLLRREEGEVLVFVDTLGKEIPVPKKEIAERRESQLSLMPSNFGEVLTPEEFNDLMAFLLAHGAK